jgi:hypothetical protein
MANILTTTIQRGIMKFCTLISLPKDETFFTKAIFCENQTYERNWRFKVNINFVVLWRQPMHRCT